MSKEENWGFNRNHFKNLEIKDEKLDMLISAINAMIRFCKHQYYFIMQVVGILDEEFQKSRLISENLPVFQKNSEISSYASTPCIENPRIVFISTGFIDQLNNANELDEILRIIFLFSTIICHELAHVVVRSQQNIPSPSSICKEGHSGYFIEQILHQGKLSQVRQDKKCIGIVLRILRESADDDDEIKPAYSKRYSDDEILKWFENVKQNGIHIPFNAKKLRNFDISELEAGQHIERGFDADEPDMKFVPKQPPEIFRLKPGQYIQEYKCSYWELKSKQKGLSE
jgi:hypothetical protein